MFAVIRALLVPVFGPRRPLERHDTTIKPINLNKKQPGKITHSSRILHDVLISVVHISIAFALDHTSLTAIIRHAFPDTFVQDNLECDLLNSIDSCKSWWFWSCRGPLWGAPPSCEDGRLAISPKSMPSFQAKGMRNAWLIVVIADPKQLFYHPTGGSSILWCHSGSLDLEKHSILKPGCSEAGTRKDAPTAW